MDKKGEIARRYFLEGYNCTQSVVLAFQEELDIERETLLRMASSFGGGMGRLREVCGAVSGMFMLAGYFYGYDNPKDYKTKQEHYERIQYLAEIFCRENHSIVCRDLLGLKCKKDSPIPEKRTEEYYKKRPCTELIARAAEIMEEYIAKHPKEV